MTNVSFRHRIWRMALLACALVLIGCQQSHQLDTAPARGVVVLNGQPLSAGSVLLIPERGRAAGGKLSADGSFVLSTYSSADGAIIGKHKVAVLPLQSDGESNEPPTGYVPVPSRYHSAASSGLEVEVKADQENVFHLTLKSDP